METLRFNITEEMLHQAYLYWLSTLEDNWREYWLGEVLHPHPRFDKGGCY